MNDRKRYQAGMSAYNAGNYAEAVEQLTSLAAGQGAPALLSRFYLGQAHYHLGRMFFEQRRFAEAAAHFQAASQANPTGGSIARFLAVCHVGTGRLDQAIGEFSTALTQQPDDAGLRIRLALAQWKQGQVVEALATLREGLCRQPEHAELNYQLGVMLAAEEDLAEAERLFERTIALDPSHAGAYERLAQCSAVAGHHERALRYLQRAHDLDPGNPRIAFQLSILVPATAGSGTVARLSPPARRKPELDQAALDRLGEAITAEPDFVEAFLELPASEVDGEVFSTLAATIERALVKHPEFADLHYHCGAVYRRLGRGTEAIRHAERAVRINPRYIKALILLAQLYAQTDQWAAGIDRLRQAIEAGADYPDVHYLIGRLHQQGQQPDQARAAYQRALDIKGDYVAARLALAGLGT